MTTTTIMPFSQKMLHLSAIARTGLMGHPLIIVGLRGQPLKISSLRGQPLKIAGLRGRPLKIAGFKGQNYWLH